jgi:hypothetical protein
MNSVVEADFSAQVIHVCKPDDEEQRPVCGESSEASFVAELNHYAAALGANTLKPGFRWCGACLKASGCCSNAHPMGSKCSRCERVMCNAQGCKHGFYITLAITPISAPEKSTGGEVICIPCADKDRR